MSDFKVVSLLNPVQNVYNITQTGVGVGLEAGISSQSSGTITFGSSAGNVTFGMANGYVTASAPSGGGGGGNTMTVSAANGSFAANSITFADSNGVSFSTGTQGVYATVVTSYQPAGAYLTTARASNDAIGLNTALTANGLSVTANSSGLSINMPAFLTTAMASAAESNFAGLSTGATNASITVNSQGINVSVASPGGGGNTLTVSAANGTFQSNAITFANSNGVSFSTGTQGVFATVATNYQSQGAYLTTARGSTDAIGLNSALTANGVSMTANSSGLSLNFPAFLTTAALSQNSSNYAGVGSAITNGTMTFNTAGLSLNLSNHLTTARASTDGLGIATAQTNVTWTANSGGLSINAAGYAGTATTFAGTNVSATLGFNSAGLNLQLSAPNVAAGNISISAGTVNTQAGAFTFADSNGVSFGLGTGANAGIITASAAGGGGGGTPLNFYELNERGNNTVYSSYGQNTLHLIPMILPVAVAISNFEMPVSVSFVSSSNSQAVSQTIRYGMYSYLTGASSDSLGLISSSQMVMYASFNSSTAAGWTISQGAASVTSTSAGSQIMSYLTGQKFLYLPFTTTIPHGEYYLGFHVSTASAVGTSPFRMSFLVMTQNSNLSNGKIGTFGASLSNASFLEEFDGRVYTATSSNLGNFNKSALSNMVSYARPYIVLENE